MFRAFIWQLLLPLRRQARLRTRKRSVRLLIYPANKLLSKHSRAQPSANVLEDCRLKMIQGTARFSEAILTAAASAAGAGAEADIGRWYMCCHWPLAVIYLIIFFPVQRQYESEARKELTAGKNPLSFFLTRSRLITTEVYLYQLCASQNSTDQSQSPVVPTRVCVVMLHIHSLLI